MKKLSIAIASLFTAIAPAAFAQYNMGSEGGPDSGGARYDNRYDSRYDSRDDYRDRAWDRGRDSARVIESRPIYEAANTKEECWNPRAGHYEELRNSDKTRVGKGAAIGAVAGGVLGHQLGDNSNANTAAGAILGGVLGHQLERRNDRDEQNDLDRSRCRVVGQNNGNIQGYEVRYEYRGQQYVTKMDRDPGNRLRVGEDIRRDGSPLDNNYRPQYSYR